MLQPLRALGNEPASCTGCLCHHTFYDEHKALARRNTPQVDTWIPGMSLRTATPVNLWRAEARWK